MPSPLSRIVPAAAMAAWLLAPALAAAHGAGPLDGYGCHEDKRRHEYHCHTGAYSGLTFATKHKMLEYRKNGVSAEEIRIEQEGPSAAYPMTPDDGGWKKWIPFRRRLSSNVARADVIVPRGIQERLRVLKDLHDQGLITAEEYEHKRKDILGEL